MGGFRFSGFHKLEPQNLYIVRNHQHPEPNHCFYSLVAIAGSACYKLDCFAVKECTCSGPLGCKEWGARSDSPKD